MHTLLSVAYFLTIAAHYCTDMYLYCVKSVGSNTQAPAGLPLINDTMVYQFVGALMELLEWVDIVKTTMFKELPPADPDWYYIRTGMPFEGQHGALHQNSLCPDHHGDEELHLDHIDVCKPPV
ncbi:40S ribosomal protein S19-like [Hordeum vulgare]|nr:40S ribosomal protein S19-like [Hordeum vulgare]